MVGLDSGSRDTFYKVKQVDKWDDVISNLHKYAVAGEAIKLKYLLLIGINDNHIDIDGFIDIAKQLRCDVKLTANRYYNAVDLPKGTLEMAKYFVKNCVNAGLNLSFEVPYFSDNDMKELRKIADVREV